MDTKVLVLDDLLLSNISKIEENSKRKIGNQRGGEGRGVVEEGIFIKYLLFVFFYLELTFSHICL
jgi:hypothetical protein